MKIVEFTTGLTMPITNEEAELMERFDQVTTINKRELNEREQIIANQLVNRGALVRKHQDGQITFKRQTRDRSSSQASS